VIALSGEQILIRYVKFILCLGLLTSTSAADEMPKVEVGKPAPDFSMTGIDGKMFKLSDKLKVGDRNVVLMFSRANW